MIEMAGNEIVVEKMTSCPRYIGDNEIWRSNLSYRVVIEDPLINQAKTSRSKWRGISIWSGERVKGAGI